MWPFISILQTMKPKPNTGSQLPTNVQLVHSSEIPRGSLNTVIGPPLSGSCQKLSHIPSPLSSCTWGHLQLWNTDAFTLNNTENPLASSHIQTKRWNSSSQSKHLDGSFLRFLPGGPAHSPPPPPPTISGNHSLAKMMKPKIGTISIIFTVTTTSNNGKNNNNYTSVLPSPSMYQGQGLCDQLSSPHFAHVETDAQKGGKTWFSGHAAVTRRSFKVRGNLIWKKPALCLILWALGWLVSKSRVGPQCLERVLFSLINLAGNKMKSHADLETHPFFLLRQKRRSKNIHPCHRSNVKIKAEEPVMPMDGDFAGKKSSCVPKGK